MREHQAIYPICLMCRLLGVCPSGYYAFAGRKPSKRALSDAVRPERIEAIHKWSWGPYGAPCIHDHLRDEGMRVGKKRVARLMQEADIKGVSRPKGVSTPHRDKDAVAAPDLVNRDFSAEAPDRLWVADITYIPTFSGFLYLGVVLDAFSRRIVGWKKACHLGAMLVRYGAFATPSKRGHPP